MPTPKSVTKLKNDFEARITQEPTSVKGRASSWLVLAEKSLKAGLQERSKSPKAKSHWQSTIVTVFMQLLWLRFQGRWSPPLRSKSIFARTKSLSCVEQKVTEVECSKQSRKQATTNSINPFPLFLTFEAQICILRFSNIHYKVSSVLVGVVFCRRHWRGFWTVEIGDCCSFQQRAAHKDQTSWKVQWWKF